MKRNAQEVWSREVKSVLLAAPRREEQRGGRFRRRARRRDPADRGQGGRGGLSQVAARTDSREASEACSAIRPKPSVVADRLLGDRRRSRGVSSRLPAALRRPAPERLLGAHVNQMTTLSEHPLVSAGPSDLRSDGMSKIKSATNGPLRSRHLPRVIPYFPRAVRTRESAGCAAQEKGRTSRSRREF